MAEEETAAEKIHVQCNFTGQYARVLNQTVVWALALLSAVRAFKALLFQSTCQGPNVFQRLGYFTPLALAKL